MDDDLDDNPRYASKVSATKPPILRCCVAVIFSIFALFFYLLFSIAFVLALIDFFVSKPTSLLAECKIVSTGVDIRSAKVCELGLLNSGPKHDFSPFEKSRFRCRYDYYWASIFKCEGLECVVVKKCSSDQLVEYKEQSSGQTFLALAEAPKEALPVDCRPSFNTAWLTKDKFKVNETYDCRYTPGMAKVDIYSDNLFNCQAKGPSSAEMMTRYSILVERIVSYLFLNKGRAKFAIQESLAGVAAGVITGLVGTSLLKLLQMPKSFLSSVWQATRIVSLYKVHLKRACFLVAYFSIMGWLTSQYFKRLGLPEIFRSS